MSSIRQYVTLHVHTTYVSPCCLQLRVFASSVLCTSYDIRLCDVPTVQFAKPYVVNTTIRHCARSYDIRLRVVTNVHLAKPDGVNTIPRRAVVCTITSQKPDGAHTTLAFVAKLDGVHTTHSARLYDTTSRRRA